MKLTRVRGLRICSYQPRNLNAFYLFITFCVMAFSRILGTLCGRFFFVHAHPSLSPFGRGGHGAKHPQRCNPIYDTHYGGLFEPLLAPPPVYYKSAFFC